MIEKNLSDGFYKRIWARIHIHNKNWMAIVCGETGSGKSYSAISIAQRIGKMYLVFSPLQFLELLNSGKLKKGDVIVFDEAGVGMSSRDWYSVQNKLLGSVMQTFRNMNLGVIFTVPNLSFVDIQARKLFHNYFETAYIDREREVAMLKCYNIQVNSRLDKTYYKRPKFTINNKIITMQGLYVKKPSENTITWYEEKKGQFTQELNRKALEDLKGELFPEKKNKIDEKVIVEKVLKNKEKYLKKHGNRQIIDRKKLEIDYGIGSSISQRVKSIVESSI